MSPTGPAADGPLTDDGLVQLLTPAGERVAQMCIIPYAAAVYQLADELSDTERGEGGFGSTGRK